jgi:glycine cleavage system H protein
MTDDFPEELRYTSTDEWVRREGDEVICGITSFAAEQLGDIVYVQLPDVGQHVATDASFGEIESVKAVSELYAPLAGEITGRNDELDENPALVNDDPYGRGWIVRLRADDPGQYDSLLDAAAYRQSTEDRQ